MQSNGTWQLLRVVGCLSFLKSMINILTAIPLSRRGPNHQGRGIRRALNESERKQITSSSIIACGYPRHPPVATAGLMELHQVHPIQVHQATSSRF
ncbi:unnamed protein product [Arctogadus glacialis]